MTPSTPDIPEQPLAIPVDTVRFIVDKLHEYENTDLLADASEAGETEPAPLDCENVDVYTEHENDYRNDPVRQELESLIHDLPDDYQIDLVALMWLGRDNSSADDWPALREAAEQAHNERTALYLLGSPLASDFLEEGLSILRIPGERTSSITPDATWSEP